MIVTNKSGISYYALERIGPNRIITPEKFLLCLDVPVSRTGRMLYGYGEVFDEDGKPLEVNGDGVTYVDRSAEDIFTIETLSSFDGKPLVNDHPEEDVEPKNWKELSVGVMLRPRRGAGVQDDLTLADLLITDPEAIEAVQRDKREVSLGYKARYQKIGPATYRQYEIVGNHIALVDSGRCGSRCSIGDKKTVKDKERNMTWLEKLKAAIGAKDDAAIDAALAEAPKEQIIVVQRGRTHDAHKDDCDCAECKGKTHDRTLDARMKKVEDAVDGIGKDVKMMKDAWEKEEKEEKEKKDKEEKETKDNTAIEGSLEMEAPPGTGDKAFFKTVKDSATAKLDEPWQEAMSLAEIIAPGHAIQLGTFDAKATPRTTLDKLCNFRKQVLGLAYLDAATHVFMDSVTGGRDFKTFDCDGVRTLFRATGQFKRSVNNRKEITSDAVQSSGSGNGTSVTPAALNKKYDDYWKNQPA